MKNGKKIILMYSQLKILCKLKIDYYADVYAIGLIPFTLGKPAK